MIDIQRFFEPRISPNTHHWISLFKDIKILFISSSNIGMYLLNQNRRGSCLICVWYWSTNYSIWSVLYLLFYAYIFLGHDFMWKISMKFNLWMMSWICNILYSIIQNIFHLNILMVWRTLFTLFCMIMSILMNRFY